MNGRTPGGPSADRRQLVASSTVRRRGAGRKALRKRLPTAAVVLVVVAGLAAAITGAVSPMPALDFVDQGHWVYNTVLHAALHIDGATARVDARANVPGDPGSQVVQGESDGYVVGDSSITVFGKSSLSVEGSIAAPSGEVPLGMEVLGTPYLVYRKAGKIVRLGDAPVTIVAGGSVGDPVFTADGTLWLNRTDTGMLCPLPKDAVRVAVCPANVPAGHAGGLTVVGDHPMFLDTTAGTLLPFGDNGVGGAIRVGVRVSPASRPASTDVAGRVAILDPATHAMHLVDPAGVAAPVTITLPAGHYSGPTSTGSAVAVVQRESDTVLTYDHTGKQRDTKTLPKNSGVPRLVPGEDRRVYVEGQSGTHVLVVDHDGAVTDVPAVPADTKDKNAPPAVPGDQPASGQPEHDERAAPNPAPSSSDNKHGNQNDQHQAPQEKQVVPPSPPGAPSSVSATGADASATVSWSAAASNRASITGYRVTWSGGSKNVSGSTGSTTISGLTNGTRYTFSVSAANSAGRGPAASSNAVTPAAAPSAPRGVSASRSGTTATVRWSAPSDLGGGTLQHYTISGTGLTTKTVTGTSTTFTVPSTGGKTITFTVKAVAKSPDGPARTGPGASASITIPNQGITISPGGETSSGDCDPPSCKWINMDMTGFDPNTTYTVHSYSNHKDPTGSFEITTDANGDATCHDSSQCDQDRYDVPGQSIYLYVDTPSGEVKSNVIEWE